MARPRDDDALAGAVRTLEHEIVFGSLMPRERLVEDDIITRFDTTRHRARRILDALVRKGLVRHIPKKGAVVRDFPVREVEELYDMRQLLQGEAIRRLPLPLGRDTAQELEDLHRKHLAAGREGDLMSLFEANNLFHARLFRETGDETLQEAIADYARRTHPIRSQGFVDPRYLEEAQNDHAEMIAAGVAGDRARLATLDRDHMRRPMDRYLGSRRASDRLVG